MDNNGIKSVDPASESRYFHNGKYWSSERLRDFADIKGYEVFDIPLKALDLSVKAFKCEDLYDFIFHLKRLKKVNYEIPIILDDKGRVADGFHCIAKAFYDGKENVKAIRLLEMPDEDEI